MGGRKGAAYVSASGRLARWVRVWWRVAALVRCRRRREAKSQLHRHTNSARTAAFAQWQPTARVEMERQRGARMPGQGSHACCARRSAAETVVRCCSFSGALEPNKRVARTVTRRFLTSRRQDQNCAEPPLTALTVHAQSVWLSSMLWRLSTQHGMECTRGPPLSPAFIARGFQWRRGSSVCRSQSTASFGPIAP